MKKLATFLVFESALAPGLTGQAMAVDIVTLQCGNLPPQLVIASQASAGITLPPSCTASATSNCSQCIADVLASGFRFGNSLYATSGLGPLGPYFVFGRS
jgi:hypothetical protein